MRALQARGIYLPMAVKLFTLTHSKLIIGPSLSIVPLHPVPSLRHILELGRRRTHAISML